MRTMMAKHTLNILLGEHRQIFKVCWAIFQQYERKGYYVVSKSHFKKPTHSKHYIAHHTDFGVLAFTKNTKTWTFQYCNFTFSSNK